MKNNLAVCEFHLWSSDVSRMYFKCKVFFSSAAWTCNKLCLSSLRRLFCIIYVGGLSQRRIDDTAIKNIVNILFCFYSILFFFCVNHQSWNNTPTFHILNDTTANTFNWNLFTFLAGFSFIYIYFCFTQYTHTNLSEKNHMTVRRLDRPK